jgi:hypothetical protein
VCVVAVAVVGGVVVLAVVADLARYRHLLASVGRVLLLVETPEAATRSC